MILVAPANVGCVTGASSNDGKSLRWVESFYDGYGEFGGKDIYALTAELNGVSETWMEYGHMRIIGIYVVLDDADGMNENTDKIISLYPGRVALLNKFRPENRGALIAPRLTTDPEADWSELNPLADCPDQGFLYADDKEDEFIK